MHESDSVSTWDVAVRVVPAVWYRGANARRHWSRRAGQMAFAARAVWCGALRAWGQARKTFQCNSSITNLVDRRAVLRASKAGADVWFLAT